ncbi:uncharacterized protein KY384_001042 [Bacidia gigantensis]|uniref:uncharacterized protein n=1 Tax=Bacidia gigantensis TaxID=2732470 RepID=UPI001D03D8C3|nr:uncharacterized protein KY384_001042 [Bacidia gigantensis]KAG8534198.1 hypothetical protein KY384_001042 [Bacidia gigantensis]
MAPTSTNKPTALVSAAGMTESVKIPKPRVDNSWAGKESFASVAAKSAPAKHKTGGLPTPPNSISPSLPPQTYHCSVSHDPPTPPAVDPVDSDIDLEDAVAHAQAQDSPHKGLTARRLRSLETSDAVGEITPVMLAKHHLPGILLRHGPLAIRHIMGYLTTSVPGFSTIPPAKARRLVGSALESRAIDGEEGGLNPDVTFEKVGWGRWDAKKCDQPTRSHNPAPRGLQIPSSHRKHAPIVCSQRQSNSSYGRGLEGTNVLDTEADQMSLDEGTRTSPPVHELVDPDDDLSMTDEEDWASIGAAALREGSCPLTGGLLRPSQRRQYQAYVEPKSRGRGIVKRPSSNFSKSMPTATNHSVYYGKQQSLKQQAAKESMDFSRFMSSNSGFGSQDRAAVEALLRMSSV